MKLNKGHYIFFGCSVLVIILLYHIYSHTEFDIEKFPVLAFFVSVIASMLASLAYSLLDNTFFRTRQDELIDRLSSAADVFDKMKIKGIVQLQCRDEIPEEYWRYFIINAGDRLILSGKTLYKWIQEDERKQSFCTNIIKKLKKGCDVTFVFYKEGRLKGGDKVERQDFKDFLFGSVFNEIYTIGEPDEIKLTIKETDKLPYFFITNGIESVAMPYFESVPNDKNLAYIMKSNCKLNLNYLEDYKEIIRNADTNTWISEYKESNGII